MGTHAALGGGVGALVGDPALGATLLGAAERMGTGGIGGYLTRAFTWPSSAARDPGGSGSDLEGGQPATAAVIPERAVAPVQAARPGVYAPPARQARSAAAALRAW